MPKDSPIKGVVFDLDGTLVDSAPDLHAAANKMLVTMGQAELSLHQIKTFIGNGVPVLVQRCLAATNMNFSEQQKKQALAQFHKFYAKDLSTLTRPYSGVMEMLKTLQGQGLFLAVCTNKPEGPARQLCASMGISRHLDAVTGGDTLDVKKPDAGPLLHTIKELGLLIDETLYVGDSETDYLTAKAAGVRFAYFNGGYQFRPIPDFHPDWELNNMGKVAVIVG